MRLVSSAVSNQREATYSVVNGFWKLLYYDAEHALTNDNSIKTIYLLLITNNVCCTNSSLIESSRIELFRTEFIMNIKLLT